MLTTGAPLKVNSTYVPVYKTIYMYIFKGFIL